MNGKSWLKLEAGRIDFRAFEWWIMRAALAWMAVSATPAGLPWPNQPAPVGIAKFFDLTWLGDPSTPIWMRPTLLICGWLLALGVAPLIGSLGLLILHVCVGTYANSQGGGGGAHHTTNLVGLMLLGQVLACLYRDVQSVMARGWRGPLRVRMDDFDWLMELFRHPSAAFRRDSNSTAISAGAFRTLQIHTILQMMAVSYVVSGISKLWRSGGDWLTEVANLPLQFEKNRLNEFHDTLIMPAQSRADAMAGWIAEHPQAAGALFGMGLFLELFCFLGLWNRKLMALFGIGLMTMHILISDLMNLGFFYHKWALLLFWINIPFWIYHLSQRRPNPA